MWSSSREMCEWVGAVCGLAVAEARPLFCGDGWVRVSDLWDTRAGPWPDPACSDVAWLVLGGGREMVVVVAREHVQMQ